MTYKFFLHFMSFFLGLKKIKLIFLFQNLYPNTHYLIEIRSHNHLGFSPSTQLVVKTARGRFEI